MDSQVPTESEASAPEPPGDQAELSVGRLTKEAVGELTGLEHRLPRTLALLVTRPGFLTGELRAGRGAAYVSPVRLYLVASAAYFASSLANSAKGVNLGFVTITGINGQLPTVAPAVILIAAVPLFAVMLLGLFGRVENSAAVMVEPLVLRLLRGRGGRPFGEFLVFALYFQSLLLAATVVLAVLPVNLRARTATVLVLFVGYVGTAARRLWTSSAYVAFSRAVISLVMYVASLGIVAAIALWAQNRLSP